MKGFYSLDRFIGGLCCLAVGAACYGVWRVIAWVAG